MTNGEKIKEIFPNAEIDKGKDGNDIWIAIDCWTTFTKDWWNAEYKEPATKNNLGVDCISRDSAIKALDYDIKCFEFKRGVNRHMDDIAKLLNTIYETQVNNIKALPSVTPQEPFINKPCISSGVCEHDKQNVLDKIRAEIEFEVDHRTNMLCAEDVFGILDKHKGESEE